MSDAAWLELAGTSGLAVFMKDTRIRYNPAERDTVLRRSIQCFCLTSQSFSAEAMAARFLDNLDAIAAACGEDAGPFIYAVHANRIERLPL